MAARTNLSPGDQTPKKSKSDSKVGTGASSTRGRPSRPQLRSASSDRFRFLRAKSPSSRATDQEDGSSSSDDEERHDGAGGAVAGSRSGLPSFTRSSSHQDASNLELLARRRQRQELIERDAVHTIQVNSGNDAGSDDEDPERRAQLEHDYEQKRARFDHSDDGGRDGGDHEYQLSDDDDHDHDHDSEHEREHEHEHSAGPRALERDAAAPGETRSHKRTSSSSSSPDDEKDNDSSSTASEEDKMDHFKHFFRRRSTVRRQSQDSRPSGGMRSLRSAGDDDADDQDQGFFSKFINYTGGGLVPGLENTDSKNSDADREKESGQHNLEEPVEDADIRDFAQQIVQSHAASTPHGAQDGPAHDPNHLAPSDSLAPPQAELDGAPSMSDAETAVPSSHNSFFAPMVGHYDDIDQQEEFDPLMEDSSYIAPPTRVRGGVLGSLLKLYQNQEEELTKSQLSLDQTPVPESSEPPTTTGKKSKKISFSTPSFGGMRTKSSTSLSAENQHGSSSKLPNFKATRPKVKNIKNVAKHANKLRRKANAEARITVHIADLLQRQRFILRMCKALMLYGAPTHRLEEYMVMTSRVLEIDGQFLYLPGCMIVSFGDATTRTSEVQLVRCNQGLNLWKLHQVHSIYKLVIHDLMSVEEANSGIDAILAQKNLYPPWVCVLLYGFCSSMVTPFAFSGDWINMATSFVIGTCVGCLQFIVSQRSNLYSNVFEVTASIVVSFCGRALGSIPKSNICFGATVQGSLALILPGYIILCGSLELQSRNIVAGAVRMFYAIIYSLFLGFGITLGAALFGWLYHGATNETTCAKHVSPWFRFIFVPAFSIGLALINQARWTQIPVMTFISCCGYVVTYFSGLHFKNSTEFTSAMAAFIIGILGNFYSRIWKGLAVSAMLPGIFVQVPSGVASQSSLLAGVQSANEITNSSSSSESATADLSSSMSFGITMIQVSIGISVGLFASTLFVYPFGKKKTGLFTL